ncbi:MAG TPA: pre-peptidase C-terminal domain-containing protein [Pyrinomonadaceae bacterium]
MKRSPSLSHTGVLVLLLAISVFALASHRTAARAQTAPRKSGVARGTQLGTPDFKSRAARGIARRADKSPSKAGLIADRQKALRACVETPTSIPATINSVLTADDCDLGDGTRYDVYSFSGAAGQQVSFTMTSTDVDAYLFLAYFDGQGLVVVGEDDDGGGGSNARIPSGSGFATLPYTDTYFLLANALDPADTLGNYTLTLATGSGTCPASPTALNFGVTNGALAVSDCRFVDDSFYDAFAFAGTAGQQVSLSLSSASFDAFVFLLDDSMNVLGANDDGGGGNNARLPATSGFVTLPYTGVYIVIAGEIPPANPNSAPATGNYTLTLTDGGTCPSTPITVGQTISNGALAAGDCRLPDETLFDLYTFSGTAGQQVSISMTAAFDAFLYLTGPDGQIFAADDDGGGGTNARIPAGSGFFTLPVTGTYHILANALDPSGAGAYTLSLSGPAPPAATLQFSAASFAAAEGGHAVTVTVTRTGPTTDAATVDYATTDGTASERRDYTTAVGRLRFAAGETSKTFDVLITDDRFDDDGESFNVTLSSPTGAILGSQTSAAVNITDNDAANGPSPVKDGSIDNEFFVRQHYADFLNRVPDPAGLTHWIGQTTNCGNPDLLVCRVNVSAAFFISIEFQQSGYLTHRAYKAAFGNIAGKPVPLTFREFLAGARRIGENVVVGQAGWELVLEANKVAFFDEFVATTRFTTAYPTSLTAAQFVDALNANTGGALSTAERDQLVSELTAGTKTRAQVLRAVAEDADFAQSEFRRAFVLAQYFGYLRRNPDDVGFDGQPDPNFVGYNFWLGKLNEFNGNYIEAEMVKGFIQSIEYQSRFGL